jgi:hypothetical protein
VICYCFWVSFKFDDHGSHQGNTVRVLVGWQHLMALHEATDALHQAMHITRYRPSSMEIKIVINLPACFVIVDSVVAHNHS